MKLTPLAASVVLTISLIGLAPRPAEAVGELVFDPTNLIENAEAAVQAAAIAAKQIEEYALQIKQFEDQVLNTTGIAHAAFVWDQAQQLMNRIRGYIDTLQYYKQQASSLDGYLRRFQDVNYYRHLTCFKPHGCTQQELDELYGTRRLGSEATKKAVDALFRGLDEQQEALERDAGTLERLQRQATTATGRQQALQAANQLAGQQSHQLLQIRALLIAQQNVIATHLQAEADRQAQRDASAARLRASRFRESPERVWSPDENFGSRWP